MLMIYKAFRELLKIASFLFLTAIVLFTTSQVNAQDIPTDEAVITAGKALFENNCTQCHAVTSDVVVGPGLKGVTYRRPLAWLIKWVKNSTLVIQSGDAYANEIYNKFGKNSNAEL